MRALLVASAAAAVVAALLVASAAAAVIAAVGDLDVAPARAACHPTMTTPLLRANLDDDPDLETVTETNITCDHERAFGIEDTCRATRRAHRLPGSGFRFERHVVEADGRPGGRELFYVLRQPEARAPELGTSAVVKLAPARPGACPRVRAAFLYRADRWVVPPPQGTSLTGFDAEVLELTRRYRGLEIRLVELFGGRGSEIRRVTLLRYARARERYVIYGRSG